MVLFIPHAVLFSSHSCHSKYIRERRINAVTNRHIVIAVRDSFQRKNPSTTVTCLQEIRISLQLASLFFFNLAPFYSTVTDTTNLILHSIMLIKPFDSCNFFFQSANFSAIISLKLALECVLFVVCQSDLFIVTAINHIICLCNTHSKHFDIYILRHTYIRT